MNPGFAWPAAVPLERSVLDGLEVAPVAPKRPTAGQRRQLDAWGLDPTKRGVFCFNAYGFNRLAYKDPQSAPCPIKAAVAPCLVAKAPGLYVNHLGRFLTAREALWLQGVPTPPPPPLSEGQAKQLAGNAMSVDVLCHLLPKVLAAISNNLPNL